jgi:hypothetical protein
VLPRLTLAEFPWRFLLPLSFVFAAIPAAAAVHANARQRRLAVVFIVVTATLGFVVPLKRYLYDPKINVAELAERMNNGTGYMGYLSMLPPGGIRPSAPQPGRVIASHTGATVVMESWQTERKKFRVTSREPVDLTVALFDNPHWQLTINGRAASHSRTPGGLISATVPGGTSDIELRFRENAHMRWGALVSVVGVFALFGTALVERKQAASSMDTSSQVTAIGCPR